MSSCQCCLTSHPLCLIERLNRSIQTIKLIRKNCFIFENILIDEYEQLKRISLNLKKHLLHDEQLNSYLSEFTSQLNIRLENHAKLLYELECITIECSVWLKKSSTKRIRSQLKQYGKRLDLFKDHHSNKTKFSKDFSIFQINYQQICIQMDTIEREYLNLFVDSIQLFSKIIPLENHEKIRFSKINIEDYINEWKEKNKFHISWLPNEHHQQKDQVLLKQFSSDIEIKAVDNSIGDYETKFVHESNLSWSFTLVKPKEESVVNTINPDVSSFSLIPSSVQPSNKNSKLSQTNVNIVKSTPMNRVRLAIEAIERNTRHFPRERKP